MSSQKQGGRRILSIGVVATLTLSCVLLSTGVLPIPPAVQPVQAQRIRSDGIWRLVYQQLPDLPLENQYVSKETGQVDADNTLVSRLIRYHLYTRGRPPFFRLDWKMTMADYLEVHKVMDESDYPSANTLRSNPIQGDIAAIKQLNRSQRDALVQALVDVFSAQLGTRSLSPAPATPTQPGTP